MGILALEMTHDLETAVRAAIVDDDDLVAVATARQRLCQLLVQVRQALLFIEHGHDDRNVQGTAPFSLSFWKRGHYNTREGECQPLPFRCQRAGSLL